MFSAKKTFLTCLSAGLFTACVGVAHAADDAVLFKIHDVVPVKNADGIVTSCDIGATFYNRSQAEINNASINLTWHDEVVADAIEQEDRSAKEAARVNRGRSVSRYNTASYNEKDIALSLKLPPLKPMQQVTLKSKVTSDRCFLLLGDLDVTVANCGTASNTPAAGAAAGRTATACDNLFRFVSSKDAEYYSEFQAKSAEEQKAAEISQIEKQRQDIKAAFDAANEELNKLTQTFANTNEVVQPVNQ